MSSLIDRCRFTPTAGGTSDWTVSTFVVGFSSPDQAGAVNNGVYKYAAESADLSQWEIGQGTYNSTTKVLTRTTVLYNSSASGTAAGQSGAGAKINFNTPPQVMLVVLAEDISTDSIALSGTLTGSFWSIDTPPARFQRMTDRVLVGEAVVQDGSRGGVGTTLTWVSPEAVGDFTYYDTRSQVEVIATQGGVAVATATRTSDIPAGLVTAPIGYAALAKNDVLNVTRTSRHSAWGHYAVAARIADATATGTGGTGGVSSTAFTFSPIPSTAPTIGGQINGTGITLGTTVTAYNSGTGVATLSAAMTVAAATTVTYAASGGAICGGAQVAEWEIANMGSVVDTNPYITGTSLDGLTYAQILGSGAEYASATPGIVNAASAALHIANVGASFRKGINISSNAIDGCNGTTGTGIAMSMAKGHELHWYYSGGVGADSFAIRSDNNVASSQTKIVATTTGLRFYDQWENTVFRINPINVASGININYCLVNNAQAGSGLPNPYFQATGTDANIGINNVAAGKGVFNWYNSGSLSRTLFRVTDAGSGTGSSVNTLAINAHDAGSNPYIAAIGSDTNIDVRTVGKGTGGFIAQDGASGVKIQANTTGVGFFGSTPTAKPTISGSRGGNAALASLLTALAAYGLITDGTSA